MLSSFITGLLKEVVLLLLHWLFDASVVTILLKKYTSALTEFLHSR